MSADGDPRALPGRPWSALVGPGRPWSAPCWDRPPPRYRRQILRFSGSLGQQAEWNPPYRGGNHEPAAPGPHATLGRGRGRGRSRGRLDAAFNNATDGLMPAPLADLEPEGFDRAIRTNIRGTFLGMKYEIPAMLRTGGGAIVNMASLAGL